MMAIMGGGGQNAAWIINNIISQQLMSDAEITQNVNFLTNPVRSEAYTYLNEKTQNVNASAVLSYVTSQLTFVPIIIMVIILMASTTLATSMVNEKADKTLETLMTTPVSRMAVLLAKVLSAALLAALYAAVYIIALQRFNETLAGGAGFPEGFIEMMQEFGVTFNAFAFGIIGAQLFLSVLAGLAIALLLGMMVDDIKSLQTYIMPLIIVIMIPYLLSMLMDINTLPTIAQVAVYAIPFTHAFTAASNLFTANYGIIIAGFIYQAVFVTVMLVLAVKIFNSDKLFSLGQMLMKKPAAKKDGFKFRLTGK
jgi:ABC-2 type transport system permease protein